MLEKKFLKAQSQCFKWLTEIVEGGKSKRAEIIKWKKIQ